jgi:putative tryptophan/tyrosine transport system substrate-binding protein
VRRRAFIAGLAGAATVGHAQAQQTGKVYRIAYVTTALPVAEMSTYKNPRSAAGKAFYGELRRLGYVEGQNLVVERYSGEGRIENFSELARDVVRSNPDLIVADSGRLVLAFNAATATIPIVGFTSDPVAIGFVSSLARPGGNITGVVSDPGFEIWGKRLELLKRAVPRVSRVGYLAPRASWESLQGAAMRAAAQREGIALIGPPLDGIIQEPEFRRVFAAMAQAGADALIVSNDSETYVNRRLIVHLAERGRLPAIYPFRECVELGGLMAYAFDLSEIFGHAADQVDQILRGTKPGDIPFYQATKFALVINLKTAKMLGIVMPSSLLAQADEVIE